MSGVSVTRPAPRPAVCVSLDDAEVVAGFSRLEVLLRRGLRGGGVAVTSEAGLLTLAASSERLLAALPAPGPPLALLTAAVRHQTDVWKDGGMSSGAVLAGLLTRLLRVSAPRHRLRAAFQLVGAECRRIATAERLRLQLEVPQLLSVVSTVLRSKRAVVLTPGERRHLSLQLLRAFLLVVPTEAETGSCDRASLGHVHLQLVDTGDVYDSTAVPALLLPEPELENTPPASPPPGSGVRRCVLFGPHLGGQEEALDGADISLPAELAARPLSTERWHAALSRLPLRPGDVVASQRTVAMPLRRALNARGLIVLERLGSRGAALLSRLSGARLLGGASLLPEVAAELSTTTEKPRPPAELVGRLDAVAVRHIGGRTYAELRRAEAPVVTLLVHYNQPEPLRQELERQLESALFALCCLLGEPAVVLGGGCLELVLINRLRRYAAGGDRVTRDVTAALCDTLRQNALAIAARDTLYSDAAHGHAWTQHEPGDDDACLCGLVRGGDVRGGSDFSDFSELTASYLCDPGDHRPPGSPPGPLPAPLDPGEISEECLVDCARVRLGGLSSALEACHAILGIGTCVLEKK